MKMDKPNLKALKALLEEVGQLNLFYKIVQSQDKEDFKSNVKYAIKSLGSKMSDRDYNEILRDVRRTAQNVNQDDIKHQILSLLDALQKTDGVIEQMTKAHFNKQKTYPVMRSFKQSRKSKAPKHRRFDFSRLTAKALSR